MQFPMSKVAVARYTITLQTNPDLFSSRTTTVIPAEKFLSRHGVSLLLLLLPLLLGP